MKVNVNIINTCCIPMSDAVTVPSLTIMTLIVSEESLARDRHTHRQTHRLYYIITFSKEDFQNQKEKKEKRRKEKHFPEFIECFPSIGSFENLCLDEYA